MAGFPLMAIGAGIGQAAKAWQEQQEARQRTMMLQLQLQRYQREMEEDKIKNEAAGGIFNLDSLGAGGVSSVGPGMPSWSGDGGASLSPSGGGIPSAASLPPMGADGVAPNMGRNFAAPAAPPMGAAPGGMAGSDQPSAPPAAARSGGGGYSVEQMTGLARRAGFSPTTAPLMAAIAMGESSGNPGANFKGLPGKPEDSYGLTQINAHAHGQKAREALNPQRAFELAFDISKGGTDFSPWTIYKKGAYRQYMPSGAAAPQPGGLPQMAQAQTAPQGAAPQQQSASGLNVPPPERVDWTQIVQRIKQQNPGMSPRAVALFADTVQKRLGENYKQAWEEYKTEKGFGLEAGRDVTTRRGQDLTHDLGNRQLSESTRAAGATEADRSRQRDQQDVSLGYEGRKTSLAESGQAADISDKAAGRKLEAGRLTEEQKRTQISKDVAEGRVTKVQGEQQLAVTQMRGISDRARDLLDAVDKNPNLVGAIGTLQRYRMSITEQAKLARYDQQLAEFRSAVKLLQAEAQKPLLGSRFFTKAGMEEIQRLIPSLDKWDSPTEVKAALRGLATSLDRKASETEAVMGGVKKDYQGLSNDDLLKQLGVPPAGAQQ